MMVARYALQPNCTTSELVTGDGGSNLGRGASKAQPPNAFLQLGESKYAKLGTTYHTNVKLVGEKENGKVLTGKRQNVSCAFSSW